MPKHKRTIVMALRKLVEERLAEKEVSSLLEFQRKYATPEEFHPELFDAPLCPFINRLCPSDLCYLPAGHEGTTEGYHITGTTAYDYAERWHYGKTDMGSVGTTREELIGMGWKLQDINA